MKKWLCVLVIILVLPRGSICSEAIIWTVPDIVVGGRSFDVFCFDNYSDFGKLELKLENKVLPTLPVDDFSIRFRFENASAGSLMNFLCTRGGSYRAFETIAVGVDMSERHVECFWSENAKVGKFVCRFSQAGNELSFSYNRYRMEIYKGLYFPCQKTPANETEVQCSYSYDRRFTSLEKNYPGIRSTSTFKGKLIFTSSGLGQTRRLNFSVDHIKSPFWPLGVLNITTAENVTCLEWPAELSPRTAFQWRVLLLPQSPQIGQHDGTIIDPSSPRISESEEVCFEFASYPYQFYDVQLWRRYNLSEAPWTWDYYAVSFSTHPARPACPPDILLYGFYLDLSKRELHVFWHHLDPLQFNGPSFGYVARTNGEEARLLTNNSAIFQNWDTTRASTVTVWSRNSLGLSQKCSQLEIPVLRNATRTRPLLLLYHFDNHSITWKPPEDRDKLVGYVVYWCRGSDDNSNICDSRSNISLQELDGLETKFLFNSSVALLNVGVSSKYRNNFSAGIQWNDPRWTASQGPSESFSLQLWPYLVGCGVVSMMVTMVAIFLLIRKLRDMRNIKVTLPEGLLTMMDTHMDNPRNSDSPSVIPIPGHIPPKAIINMGIANFDVPTDKVARFHASQDDVKSIQKLDSSGNTSERQTNSYIAAARDISDSRFPSNESNSNSYVVEKTFFPKQEQPSSYVPAETVQNKACSENDVPLSPKEATSYVSVDNVKSNLSCEGPALPKQLQPSSYVPAETVQNKTCSENDVPLSPKEATSYVSIDNVKSNLSCEGPALPKQLGTCSYVSVDTVKDKVSFENTDIWHQKQPSSYVSVDIVKNKANFEQSNPLESTAYVSVDVVKNKIN